MLVVFGKYQRETPIHTKTREGINYLLEDGYEVNDDQKPAPYKKPSGRCQDNDQPWYR